MRLAGQLPVEALQLSPIWRCNILQKYFATFAKKYLQKTLDKNTVQYMIDEMQETIDSQQETINGQQNQLEETNRLLSQALEKIKQLENAVNGKQQ